MDSVIGIDFGTLSARAVAVNVENGEILASHTVSYENAITADALVDVRALDSALDSLLHAIALPEIRCGIRGICVDATSLTLIPLAEDGKALCYREGFENRANAQAKLWKRHTAQKQAEEALYLARSQNIRILGRTGGSISCEWTLPKIMETYDEDRECYELTDCVLDECEYLTYRLTGSITRSAGSMSYKSLWAEDLGFPPDDFLNALRPGLGRKYAHLLRGPVLCASRPAGYLTDEWRKKLDIPQPVVISAGVLDGHTTMIALGALNKGDAALVTGTSNVLTLQSETLREVEGICGIAKDGIVPGLYATDSGQSCTGDMLAWFTKHMLPAEYASASPHESLARSIREPWNCPLTVTDWWNGSRNAPCDLSLPGTVMGLSLDTRAEDLYLAMIQSIACGTREILELCEANGLPAGRIVIGGGMARKSRLLKEQYANILGRTVEAAQADEVPALGAAITAAAAAGLYPSIEEAASHMGVKEFETFLPDPLHRAEYEELYRRNHALRQALAAMKR